MNNIYKYILDISKDIKSHHWILYFCCLFLLSCTEIRHETQIQKPSDQPIVNADTQESKNYKLSIYLKIEDSIFHESLTIKAGQLVHFDTRNLKTILKSSFSDIDQSALLAFKLVSIHGCGGSVSYPLYSTAAIQSDCTIQAQYQFKPRSLSTPNINLLPIKKVLLSWNKQKWVTHYQLEKSNKGDLNFYPIEKLIPANQNSFEYTAPLFMLSGTRYRLQHCVQLLKASFCAPSLTTTIKDSDLNNAIGYIKASNTNHGDGFGRGLYSLSMSADGKRFAVAAFSEDGGDIHNQEDNTVKDAGAVYVFSLENNGWQQEAYLKADVPILNGDFGRIIYLSADGNTLMISARKTNHGSSGVFSYIRSTDGHWKQNAFITKDEHDKSDHLGGSISMNDAGNILAISTTMDDNKANHIIESESPSGGVYIFEYINNEWIKQDYIQANNADNGDFFGRSISLNSEGTLLAVSADREDSDGKGINADKNNNAKQSGAVYIFSFNEKKWLQTAYLKASNAEAGDLFGFKVGLSGDGKTLAVSALKEKSRATGINGDQLNNDLLEAGAVYIFNQEKSDWIQSAYIKPNNIDALDEFGFELELSKSGTVLFVSSYEEDGASNHLNGNEKDNSMHDAGAGYIFILENGKWVQKTYIKPPKNGKHYSFGFNAALSHDHQTLIISSPFERSSATGINGNHHDESTAYSGAVYLY